MQISGKILAELRGEVHPKIALLQALCCAPRSTEQSTFEGGQGQKGADEKRGGRGVASKGAKRKKGRATTGQLSLTVKVLLLAVHLFTYGAGTVSRKDQTQFPAGVGEP